MSGTRDSGAAFVVMRWAVISIPLDRIGKAHPPGLDEFQSALQNIAATAPQIIGQDFDHCANANSLD